MSTQLIKFFKKEEFSCPCCGLFNLTDEMIDFVNKVRIDFGSPMIINSGTRCDKHNKMVGGVSESSHLKGLAIDVKCLVNEMRSKLVKSAYKNGCKRIGISSSFIHLDIMETGKESLWLY